MQGLGDMKQLSGKTETTFSDLLNKAFYRCSNALSLEERCSTFLDGLYPAIQALVAQYRGTNRMITFLEIVHYFQAEEDTFRASRWCNLDSRRTLLEDSTNGSTSLPDGSPSYPNKYHTQAMGHHPTPVRLSDNSSINVPPSDSHAALDARENHWSEKHPIAMVRTPRTCMKICAQQPQVTEIFEKWYDLVHLSQECNFRVSDRLRIINRY